MYYQKSTQESEKHVLGVFLDALSNGVVRFLDALSNGVVRFLLSFQYHTFCKTVTEVKPHFVKNVKMT